ncbi:MAG: LysR substrate-binding domain-containing protein [Silicimonas sp.]|uniref:LysR substrate-binding domain-containing protein n=1 Tax=Marinovum algicola TaxID=42444 RepID=UPI0032EC4D57
MFSRCGVVPDTRMEFSQTHAIISMVNQGIGFAIVPSSARVLQMENIVYRELDLPGEFRSDMYLVSGRSQSSHLRDQVKRLIVDTLRPFHAA